jgi:hypothetical protein
MYGSAADEEEISRRGESLRLILDFVTRFAENPKAFIHAVGVEGNTSLPGDFNLSS